MFPSRALVFRAGKAIDVLMPHGSGLHWGCSVGAKSAKEAVETAERWVWQNVERDAAKGCLSARVALLERALNGLCEGLRSTSASPPSSSNTDETPQGKLFD